ncbi:homoserine kinase [Laceyella tengchongensis]|uniref:Homoserine kinase n=1 Tax=Laceyella tengchongensis TaxID=574699 RepID=A0AA45WRP5_9BACL|nr:homoserine kinase [Laceyella tengchongensis]SMP32584.1 homoserine kinase [Laceyella tengchongensis]
MMSFAPFEVSVPCSTANLGPGFDSVGLAFNRYLRLRFSPATHLHIRVVSGAGKDIPLDENNLIINVMKQAFAEAQATLPPFTLEIENEIPLARGLGSSAAAIVGAYLAANRMLGEKWSKQELLQRATRWEGHPDNVGASLYGGMVVGTWDEEQAHILPCPPPELPFLAVIPQQMLFTEQARRVLPKSYSKEDAILSSSRANLLVAALLQKRWEFLSVAMDDLFHQPYRLPLVPGLQEAIAEARHHGAYGVALSGAGPTLLAACENVQQAASYFRRLYEKLGIAIDLVELSPCLAGAQARQLDQAPF